MTQEEFKALPTAAMDEYMNNVKETHPAHRERFSNQAWLVQGKTADQVLKRIRNRRVVLFGPSMVLAIALVWVH